MRDNDWVNLLVFGGGVLAGVMLIALLPGMPWLTTVRPTDANRDLLDLAAQQGMMVAAYWMVAISTVGAIVGLGSLIFLRANLIEAQKVTREAMRSANAADLAAEQARKSTEVQLDLGQRQLRAYCVVNAVSLVQLGDTARFVANVTNAGQSPALTVSLRVTVKTSRSGHEPLTAAGTGYLPDIPGSDAEAFTMERSAGLLAPDFTGAKSLMVHLELKYRDVFDRWHMSDYWYRTGRMPAGPIPLTELSRRPNMSPERNREE